METNITCRVPLNTILGYGKCGYYTVKSLHDFDLEISLFPIGHQISLTTDDNGLIQSLLQKSMDNFKSDSPCIICWHEFDLLSMGYGNGKKIAYTFFECNELDDRRRFHMNNMDAVATASEWGRQVLLNNGVKKNVLVAPCGVDNTIFTSAPPQSGGPYKFFTIGKFEKRKCTEMIPQIFEHAFPTQDDVEIYILCDSPIPHIQKEIAVFRNKIQASKKAAQIHLVPSFRTDKEVAQFIQQMDCGLFLTRAEGFGLPILETMACNRPVITTNYSGQTEFCNEDNAMLVDIREFEPAHDGIWFHGLGTWAKIHNNEIDETIDYMRAAYHKRMNTNKWGVQTASIFSWSSTAYALLGECL